MASSSRSHDRSARIFDLSSRSEEEGEAKGGTLTVMTGKMGAAQRERWVSRSGAWPFGVRKMVNTGIGPGLALVLSCTIEGAP